MATPLKIEEKGLCFCCSRGIPPKTPEEKRAWARVCSIDISGVFAFKMSAAERKTFSSIFICEANKNRDSAKDVRASARENFGV